MSDNNNNNSKNNNNSNTKKKRVHYETIDQKFFAFWGMIIAAAVFLVGGIFYAVGLGTVARIVSFIASLLILLAIAFPAWNYVAHKNSTWKIIYVVGLILYIAGAVLGICW